MSKKSRRVRQSAVPGSLTAFARLLSEPFVPSPPAGPAPYPRAGVGPAPDGMPPERWAEAGDNGLYYIGREPDGSHRFTDDPYTSVLFREWFPGSFNV